MHIKNNIIVRNGEQHLQINSINLSVKIVGDFKMVINFNTPIPKILQGAVNEQVNSNWRQIKPHLETDLKEYIKRIVYELVTPIFTKVPIQKFFIGSSGYQ